ncbi:lysine/cadaverine antiporter [Vibrio cholerae]|nr:probable cadaverine/lysine antiporter [Vibrio cholerae NCTC 8457]CRZ53279.1 lysine/cadaverine antiporter [Vibrio cholerae]
MSLIILMFYSKKAGLDKYLETHPQQASAQF